MKKMRKIFAVLLTLAMVLTMSMTAFAAKTGATLKVKGLATNAQQHVDIYEIYRLDDKDNGWKAADWTDGTGVTPENLNTEEMLTKLKTAALNNGSATRTSSTQGTDGKFNGEVSFSNLQAGAYLVLVTDTANKVKYATMVARTYKYDNDKLISPLDAEVVAKADEYKTDKSANKTDAEIGDLVTYTVKTTVPYQEVSSDGKTKKVTEFKVNDKLEGAKYYLEGDAVKGENPVNTITVNGSTVKGLEKLDASVNGQSNFTLDLINLVKNDNTYAGQEVVITYTAKVENVNTIKNEANSTHKSEGTTTYTYTGNATITKFDKEWANKLKGAQFVVYREVTKDDAKVKEYAVIDENGWITGEWRPEGENHALPEGIGSITTSAEGTATVKGLKIGEYYFQEVVAPDGYSINTTDVKFKMIAQVENQVVTGVVAEKPKDIKMNDTKLSALPSTGGIGTTIFTIAGCLIMVTAAGLFFASRKKANK